MVDTSFGTEMPLVRLVTACIAALIVLAAPVFVPGARGHRVKRVALFARIGSGGSRKERGRHV
jgi:hypothetical protein